ncbi:MAG: kelch repeat-containing protein [Ginsengibacter sp.]
MKTKQALLLLSIISFGILSCSKSSSTATVLGNWVSKSGFDGVARSEAVSFVINDTAYIGTGYDGTSRLNDLWKYDAVKNFWEQKADLPGAARNSAIAFVASGKGYVGTGFDGLNKLKDMWQYDPAANSWIQKNDFAGSARYDAVSFAILDKGYISTGFDGNYLKDFWEYDPSTDAWTLDPGFGGSKRMAAVAFVYNNKGYICTGTNNGTAVNDFWSYDPSTSAWTELRQITNISADSYDDNYTDIIRSNAAAFVIGSKAYLTTGENGSLLSSTWEYDFASDLWTSKTAFEGSPRTGAVAFSVNSEGYVTTGRSSTLPFDDLRQFFPDQTYNAND